MVDLLPEKLFEGFVMQYSYSGSAVPQQEATMRFGSARSAIHMSSVRCQGDEQNLLNCTYEDVAASETPEDTLAVVCKQGIS